jgi:hypothetical protein
MTRHIEPELLDELSPDNPGATGSRRDLRRLNTWMGHIAIAAQTLRASVRAQAPCRILDLGAGDGRFLLGVARRLARDWPAVEVTLLDRQNIVDPAILRAFAQTGWTAKTLITDVLDWGRQPASRSWGVVITNLFLHHFSDAQLAELFPAIARRAPVLVALEPRRCARSLLFSRLIWLIGCNRVTRHDALASVRAGFAGRELSRLWPDAPGWSLEERPAGRFSHLFIARNQPSASLTEEPH